MTTTNIQEIQVASLHLFNGVLEQEESVPYFIEEYGVYIEPKAYESLEVIKAYLRKKSVNKDQLNKTFYKSWDKIREDNKEKLLKDQLMHYMTTYGDLKDSGTIYIPEGEVDVLDHDMPLYVIKAFSKEELVEKTRNLLKSGIAMKQETIEYCLTIIQAYDNITDTSWIKNKEAMCIISERTNTVPSDPQEALRLCLYVSTGSTLLIKNQETIDAIVNTSNKSFIKKVFENDPKSFAKIFNRYKRLFLAYKKHTSLKKVINKISKLSKVYHEPMVQNPLNMVSSKVLKDEDKHWLDNATPFALFRALNVCSVYMNGKYSFVYKIRNGKTWTTNNSQTNMTVAQQNYDILLSYIKQKFSHLKGKKVYYPSYIDYGLPTSEKQYIGAFPYNTKVISEKLCAGIYWENKWGAVDLDLSSIDASGGHIGWNASYGGKTITYSGDMTNATNGATEYLYADSTKSQFKNKAYIVNVNCYASANYDKPNHKYNIIVGIGDDKGRKYMMNPENLVLQGSFESKTKNSILGFISEENGNACFSVFPMFGTGARVSSFNELTSIMINSFKSDINYGLTLGTLFKELGVKVVGNKLDCDIDLDPDTLETNTIIDIFK